MSNRFRTLAGFLVSLTLLASAGCGDDPPESPPIDGALPPPDASLDGGPPPDGPAPSVALTLPAPTGSYAVSRGARRTIVDPTRGPSGSSPGSAAAPRKISFELWYPTSRPAAGTPVAYLDDVEGPFAKPIDVTGWWHKVRTNSAAKAGFATGARRPVILLSPGYTVLPRQYTATIEELVSHGYVVAAMSHTFWTSLTVFADGTTTERTMDPSSLNATTGDVQIAIWSADARLVLDELTRLDASDPLNEVTGHLDLTAVGMLGHSFGGATAIDLASTDARVKAAVNLDGTLYGDPVHNPSAKPILLFGADRPSDDSWLIAYQKRTGPAYWLTLGKSKHFNFSDVGIDRAAFAQGPDDTLGTIDPARALVVIDTYVLAFFDQYLAATPSPLLTGLSAAYPEITKLTKRP